MCVKADGYTEQNIIRRRDIPYATRIVSETIAFPKKKKEEKGLEKGY